MQEIESINLVDSIKKIETNELIINAKSIILATGAQAKKLGRLVEMNPNFETKKLVIMTEILTEKFYQNPVLMEKLLATKDAELIEGNWWGDTFWGICTNKKMDHIGENWLGKILMSIRSKEKDKGDKK